jgi:hypothetical protein
MAYVTLTDDQKVMIRHHTGYPNQLSVASSALGVPSTIESSFIIEQAMNQVSAPQLPLLVRLLDTLDIIETQMTDDLELLAVTAVAEISIRQDEQPQLQSNYRYWVSALCNLLAIEPNPYDQRYSGGSGINVSVRH